MNYYLENYNIYIPLSPEQFNLLISMSDDITNYFCNKLIEMGAVDLEYNGDTNNRIYFQVTDLQIAEDISNYVRDFIKNL